jgi:hypothetical protein
MVNGTIDPWVLRNYGRHEYFIQYADPPRLILNTMAASYPACQMIAKVTLAYLTEKRDPTNFSGALWLLCESRGALIKNPGRNDFAVNILAPGLVDDIVDKLIVPRLMHSQPWKGLHIEHHLEAIAGLNQARWDDAINRLWTKLATVTPKEFKLWWNGGCPEIPGWIGVMLENYPFGQSPLDAGQRGAYALLEDWNARGVYPTPIIFTAMGATPEINLQKFNYGTACAYLFNAIHVFAPQEPIGYDFPGAHPEYGAPTSGIYQEVFDRDRRDGTLASVIVDPTYPANVQKPSARGRAWIIQ